MNSAMKRKTWRDWFTLAEACVIWMAALIIAVSIVYGIATVPAGWWLK